MGDSYEGEVLRNTGTPNGRGMLIDRNKGFVYEGWFKKGMMHGYGRLLCNQRDGFFYEGDFHLSEMKGLGTSIWYYN